MVRKSDLVEGDDYYGPFTSIRQTHRVLKTARKIFKFCSQPENGQGSQRPCFYYHLDMCDGACVGKVKQEEYRRKIGYLKRFLQGETKTLLKKMDRRIRKKAREEKYEEAKKLKQTRRAVFEATQLSTGLSAFLKSSPQTERELRNLQEILRGEGMEINLNRIEGYDVSTLQQKDTVGAMVVFIMGVASKEDYRLFKMRWDAEGDTAAMEEMLERRFQHREWPQPDLVVVDGGKPQVSAALKIVSQKIPVVGIAKQEERLVLKKQGGFKDLQLKKEWPGRDLLLRIRDKAHKFSNQYQKKVRRRSMIDN